MTRNATTTLSSFSYTLLLLISTLCACDNRQTGGKDASSHADSSTHTANEDVPIIREMESYNSSDYNISLEYPAEWILLEQIQTAGNALSINIFPKGRGAEQATPLHLHGDAGLGYVAIWPKGIGTELPSGASKTISANAMINPELRFEWDAEQSKVFLLNDSSIWAYFLVPADPPDGWSAEGFIFAQYGLRHFTATCYDAKSGDEKPLERCDPLAGDRFVREGEVRSSDKRVVDKILSTMQLGAGNIKAPIGQLIQVEKPLPNMDVTSPLTIKGKAKGYWFFEANFPVKLLDAHGNVLTESYAQADGEWMTEDFVDFSATLEFDAPDDERGMLVLERANASGLPEHDRHYQLPVIFPPK
jgi:hypothetical protein